MTSSDILSACVIPHRIHPLPQLAFRIFFSFLCTLLPSLFPCMYVLHRCRCSYNGLFNSMNQGGRASKAVMRKRAQRQLSRSSTRRRVTFGSVTVVHIPRYRASSSPSSLLISNDSQASTEATLLLSPPTETKSYHTALEDARDTHVARLASPDSECSLLLTQVAPSCLSSNETVRCNLALAKEEEDGDDCAVPASVTATASFLSEFAAHTASPTLPVLSSPIESSSSLKEASIAYGWSSQGQAAGDRDVLGGTPLSLSVNVLTTSGVSANMVEEKVTVEAAGTMFNRTEMDGARSSTTCVFCHSDDGYLDCYGGHHLHLACALWCPEVYYDTEEATLKNVDAALVRSRFIKCVYCRQPGAPVGCVREECQRSYHLHCALNAGASLNETAFELRCSKHALKQDRSSLAACDRGLLVILPLSDRHPPSGAKC